MGKKEKKKTSLNEVTHRCLVVNELKIRKMFLFKRKKKKKQEQRTGSVQRNKKTSLNRAYLNGNWSLFTFNDKKKHLETATLLQIISLKEIPWKIL